MFMPLSAVTTAAPPRMSMAVTMTASNIRYESALPKPLGATLCRGQLTHRHEDEGDVGDVRRRPPPGQADLAHSVHRRTSAPHAGNQSLPVLSRLKNCEQRTVAHSLALDLYGQHCKKQNLDRGSRRIPGIK